MIRINDQSVKGGKRLSLGVLVLTISLTFFMAGQTAQAVPNGGYAHPEILIQPEELRAMIGKKEPRLRVIDIREKVKYVSGHIPGAVHMWRPDIEDKNHPLPGMMAPKTQIEQLLGSLGIGSKDVIVIYSDGPDNGRLWWVLAYYGFPLDQIKILDGGFDGWEARDYPTQTASPKALNASFGFPTRDKKRAALLCNLSEIKSALKETNTVVLDVRSKEEFLGEKTKGGAAKPGRIPGVIWIEWKEALVKEGPYKGYWKPAGEIERLFATKGVTPEKDVYMY
jgi:thiosulfate/3-mercaptopyruvate sulfurtransferase